MSVCIFLFVRLSLSELLFLSFYVTLFIHPSISSSIHLSLSTHIHTHRHFTYPYPHTHHRHIDPHPESLPFHFHLTKRGQPRGQKPDNLIYFQVFQLVIRWLIQTPLKTFYYVSETKVAGSFFLEVLLFLDSDHKQKQTPML